MPKAVRFVCRVMTREEAVLHLLSLFFSRALLAMRFFTIPHRHVERAVYLSLP
jgi:hypothetical protein